MTISENIPTLNYDSIPLFGINRGLLDIQEQSPVARVRTPAGDEGWLVTRYSEAKQLLLDTRIGRTHRDPGNAPKYMNNPMMDVLRGGVDFDTEPQIHMGTRAALAPYFSGRAVSVFESRMAGFADAHVRRLAEMTPPLNIHSSFSQPLSMMMLCELLGVPESDREIFPQLVRDMSRISPDDQADTARQALQDYFLSLSRRLREDPQEFSVLSGIAASGMSDENVAALGMMLLFAGFESTSSNTSVGVARIGSDPQLRERLLAEPHLIKTAVEEFMRTSSAGGLVIPHYAREDIELEDVTIRGGDLILIDLSLANMDDRQYADPRVLDITRKPNPHLTFSHGSWHCVGAPLARVHLRLAFTALLEHLPTVRLATSLEEVVRTGRLGGGFDDLSVTW